jgi:hypothetical protein
MERPKVNRNALAAMQSDMSEDGFSGIHVGHPHEPPRFIGPNRKQCQFGCAELLIRFLKVIAVGGIASKVDVSFLGLDKEGSPERSAFIQ